MGCAKQMDIIGGGNGAGGWVRPGLSALCGAEASFEVVGLCRGSRTDLRKA